MIPKAQLPEWAYSYDSGASWHEVGGRHATARDAAIAAFAHEDIEDIEDIHVGQRVPLAACDAAQAAGEMGGEYAVDVMQSWAWDHVGEAADDWLAGIDREEREHLERNLTRAVMAWFNDHPDHAPYMWSVEGGEQMFTREDLATEVAEAEARAQPRPSAFAGLFSHLAQRLRA